METIIGKFFSFGLKVVGTLFGTGLVSLILITMVDFISREFLDVILDINSWYQNENPVVILIFFLIYTFVWEFINERDPLDDPNY
jgi:phosphotransferase system  glucose/maltose/N-acetylglucosamine-specific IIC component